jgi:NAD(P)-dependent dehydrogenase (short-subunit alcohol dehydrogenase family)
MLATMMLPKETFANRCVLITGGGTGLGLQTARDFAALGARLVLASRSEDHLLPAAEELSSAGAEVLTVVTDVRRPGSVRSMLEAALQKFGAVDVLVNNAAGNFLCPSKDLSPGGWKVVIDIALNGVFYCSREIGLHMLERGSGRIINIVAAYAWTGGPGTVHSAAAKAGVVAMTRTLAVEWAASGIRVNAVCPGIFQSEGARSRLWPTQEAEEALQQSVPLKRFAETHEVSQAITYLASPYADYINGEVLVIDGGLHLGQGLGGGPTTPQPR